MSHWGTTRFGNPCRECGYDWSMTTSSAIALIHDIPQRYADLLNGRDATLKHPDLHWTAGGYVCHVVDNLRIWAERLASAALSGDVIVTGYDDDLLARARNYNRLPASGALWSLQGTATAWQQAIDLAIGSGVILQHPERGPQPAADVACTNAHDAYHHAWDIQRTLAPDQP